MTRDEIHDLPIKWQIKGCILGMLEMGGQFRAIQDEKVYFDIVAGTELDDNAKLIRAAEAFKLFGITLRIKKLYLN